MIPLLMLLTGRNLAAALLNMNVAMVWSAFPLRPASLLKPVQRLPVSPRARPLAARGLGSGGGIEGGTAGILERTSGLHSQPGHASGSHPTGRLHLDF